MGWKIFAHSVRQVFGNFMGALRVSGVLFLIQMAIAAVLLGPAAALNMGVSPLRLQSFGEAIVLVVLVVSGLWIAVGWHRYVLLDERPGLIPKLQMGRMLGYFGIGILISLVMIIPILIMTFVAGTVISALLSGIEITVETALSVPYQLGATVILVLVYIPIMAVAFRLSTTLPGVALEPGKGVFDGLTATQDQNGAYFGLATVCVVAYVLGSLPPAFLPVGGVFSSLYQIVFQWVTMMVGLSILTTLYGHFIEKRALV